jgi:predicted RNA binding protein YcfA (HicA-like mRNA interferase family)
MKRGKILKYLHEQGCILIREGGNHSIFINPKNERTSTVPRHQNVHDFLVEKICKDLGIISVRKKKK